MFGNITDIIYAIMAIVAMLVGFSSAIKNARLSEVIEKASLRRYFIYYALTISLLTLLFESFVAQQLIPNQLTIYSLRLIHLFLVISLYLTAITLLSYSETTLAPQSKWLKPLMQISSMIYLFSLLVTTPFVGTTQQYRELFLIVPSIVISVVLLHYVFKNTADRINNVYLSGLIKSQGNLATGALITIGIGATVQTYTQNGIFQFIFIIATILTILAMKRIANNTNQYITDFKKNSWQTQLANN